jgi:NADH-quinone oxidoreductase subunit C
MSDAQSDFHPAIEKLRAQFGEAIVEVHAHRGDHTVVVSPERYHEAVAFLHRDPECSYDFMTDLSGLDRLRLQESPRFEVIVHLYSTAHNDRLRIKTRPTDDVNPTVDTITDIFPAANWPEREVWDMFGVKLTGHPNLKRILLYEEFVGHPLRKDYPVNKRQPLVVERPVHDTHNPRLFYT